jgi:hypothetical protein
MNSCKLGLHKWAYTHEGKVRWCKKCQKKQDRGAAGKWVESRPLARPKDNTKYCECPRDYTVSIRLQLCPRCGLPRRTRVIPSGSGDTSRPR